MPGRAVEMPILGGKIVKAPLRPRVSANPCGAAVPWGTGRPNTDVACGPFRQLAYGGFRITATIRLEPKVVSEADMARDFGGHANDGVSLSAFR